MRLLILLLILTAAACAGRVDLQSSPQTTHRAWYKALEEKNFYRFCQLVDPEDRNLLIISVPFLAMAGNLSDEDFEEMGNIGKRHGIKKDKTQEKKIWHPTIEELREAYKDVEDKCALYSELMSHVDRKAVRDTNANDISPLTKVVLRSVLIEGEKAQGTGVSSDGTTKVLQFSRREGRWYLRLTEP